MIPAVSPPGLPALLGRAFRVGAGEIIEHDVGTDIEELLPALPRTPLQRPLVFDDLVQGAIEPVLACDLGSASQQELHRGAV